MSAFAWRDWGKPQSIWAMITGVAAETRNEHLSNRSTEHHRWACRCLGKQSLWELYGTYTRSVWRLRAVGTTGLKLLACFLLCFDPEDGGNKFLRSVGEFVPGYRTSQPKIYWSSIAFLLRPLVPEWWKCDRLMNCEDLRRNPEVRTCKVDAPKSEDSLKRGEGPAEYMANVTWRLSLLPRALITLNWDVHTSIDVPPNDVGRSWLRLLYWVNCVFVEREKWIRMLSV
jgi:hypothetical protein